MTGDLKDLSTNRDALLLAEVAAWLHDMGKCNDEMIVLGAWDKPDGFEYDYKTKCSCLVGSYTINLLGESVSLKELIEQGVPGAITYRSKKDLIRYLGRCHAASHIEKEEHLSKEDKKKLENKIKEKDKIIKKELIKADKKRQTANLLGKIGKGDPEKLKNEAISIEEACLKLQAEVDLLRDLLWSKIKQVHQSKNSTFSSNPFGFESKKIDKLTQKLKSLPFNKITNRSLIVSSISASFTSALGDTRRPTNEVTLTDWSGIVAALYKSALAGELLGNKRLDPNDLKWQLLAIRFDSKKVWENASKIPILNARRKWVTDGLDRVKNLLEETYPLGNEVYRDENGSIFVVPAIPDLLKITDSKENKTLEELISKTLGYEGEIVVTPSIDKDPWWGQDPEYLKKRREGKLDEINDKIPPIGQILSENEKPLSPPDTKTVKKWWDRTNGNPEICTISWMRPQGPDKTGLNRKASDYWAEKVTNRAKDWLENRHNKTIWIDEVTDSRGRICLITGKLDISDWLKPEGHIKTLLVKPSDASNVAETKNPSFVRMRRIWGTTKAFWDAVTRDLQESICPVEQRLKITGGFNPENSVDQLTKFSAYEAELGGVRFNIVYTGGSEYIIIENLQRLAEKMGVTVEQLSAHTDDKILIIYDSEGKNRQMPLGHLSVSRVESEPTSYIPAIPILSEPIIFMAIVPADKALEVANYIKEKYEKEMGKVRNRLPLTLGMVFAKSHTPLAALMDAGRRMLPESHEEEDWILYTDVHDCGTECILNFTNKQTWHIPVMMGDGVTEDVWYPYFYVNGVPTGRPNAFKGPNGWLIHVKELKKDDTVKISPSRFDFEFLDSASRRFEISYDQESGKRRDFWKSERPYLLEELEQFQRLWEILSENLARTQTKNVVGLIETKREEWLSEGDIDPFKRFVHDVLHNANWMGGLPPEMEELEDAAVSGKLRDIVELYIDIIKDRDKSGGV
jgi:hypothetical protein